MHFYENSSRNNGLHCTVVNAPGICTTKTNFPVVIKISFVLVSRTLWHLCTVDYEITFILEIPYKWNKWVFSHIKQMDKWRKQENYFVFCFNYSKYTKKYIYICVYVYILRLSFNLFRKKYFDDKQKIKDIMIWTFMIRKCLYCTII